LQQQQTQACGGIEHLKLAFLSQVTYKTNQVSTQLQLKKIHAKRNHCNQIVGSKHKMPILWR
jgi:hypothetical protein